MQALNTNRMAQKNIKLFGYDSALEKYLPLQIPHEICSIFKTSCCVPPSGSKL